MFVVLLGVESVLSGGEQGAAGAGGHSLIDVFRDHPVFLSLNLVCSALVVAMIIERVVFQLTKYSVNSKEFLAQVKKLVLAGNIDRAIKLCEAGDYPILQLVKSGLTHANKGPDDIDAAMSEKLGELKPNVDKRIGSLWSLANIATLIGLLGTVSGLISTFNAVADPRISAALRQSKLAGGISEAMINTAFGLGIAVSCMVAHLFLHQRAKSIQHDLDATQERVFNLLTIQTRPGGF
jgi:biopolymer transport protein ExbB/TolQ